MVSVRYGGKNGRLHEFHLSHELVVVRTHSRKPLVDRERPFEVAPVSAESHVVLDDFRVEHQFREAGVQVIRAIVPQSDPFLRDEARMRLSAEPEIRFAGRALIQPQSGTPVVYTENFFVKFTDRTPTEVQQSLLQQYGLIPKRTIAYAANAYFVAAPEGTGLRIFDIAANLLQEEVVELCHPELVQESRSRRAFPQQWHLAPTTINNTLIDAHANVEASWNLSRGSGTTIAVIDTGTDVDHEEFRSSNKVVAPRDATRGTNDPRPRGAENHGTACAGVACANGNFGASGVAPSARLMPIRLVSGLGSQAEADAFYWATINGADVISCSWGPPDGAWWNPNDPLHNQVFPLPDSTRLAIDYAVEQGRNGRGCVICWAAGNGNESVDNDGYASYERVLAIAASNDQNRRSVYSDFGNAIWCAFPSNDAVRSLAPGIWTTDRMGVAGYNPGNLSEGDAAGNYTNSFGGTSSSCPGVAGVAALILARNLELRWDEVREILRQSCDPIDLEGGQYDADGRSPFYGYGRVNALRAVELAIPPAPFPTRVYRAIQDVPIRDLATASLSMMVPVTNALKSLKVEVDIEHTYVGDLIVMLKPPVETGVVLVTLHNRGGGNLSRVRNIFDEANTPSLRTLHHKSPKGQWVLEVVDKAGEDVGMIRGFSLEMRF
jgi:subtilisin family serine protease